MEEFLRIQLDYLLVLQAFRDYSSHIFDGFFCHVTMFGEFLIPVMIVAFIYWIIDKKCAVFMMWCLSLGLLINQFLKNIACIYRPWIFDSRIKPVPEAMKMATGYSFPSGHTAIAVSTFGAIAVYCWKNRILRYFLIILVLLVAFSRNYLGVHTPQDVVVSVISGVFLFFAVPRLLKWVDCEKNNDIYIYIIFLILAVFLVVYTEFKSYPVDYVNNMLLVDPAKMKIDAYPKAGFAVGFLSGWILDRRMINYVPKKSLLDVSLAIIGLACIWLLLEKAISVFSGITSLSITFLIIFFTLGFFITGLYPAVIKLVRKI